jgi:hypothetical protein
MNSDSKVLKPIIAGLVCTVLDNQLTSEKDIRNNAVFGAVVGAGIYTAEMLAPPISQMLPQMEGPLANGKTVANRIVEVGLASGASYAVNNAIGNEGPATRGEMMNRLAIIVASDFIAEYATDYITGKPLGFLN